MPENVHPPIATGRDCCRKATLGGGLLELAFCFRGFGKPDWGGAGDFSLSPATPDRSAGGGAARPDRGAGLAAVSITFYSKELGASFPHAFVIVEGSLDRGGPRIEEDYGFTAKTISPAILWGKVAGEVITDHTPSYVKGSDRHFTVTITDAEYDRAMATVARWRSARQPSYDLDRHNCVHFVAEIAASVGLVADTRRFMKKPRSYLQALTETNRARLASRGAVLHRLAAPAQRKPRA